MNPVKNLALLPFGMQQTPTTSPTSCDKNAKHVSSSRTKPRRVTKKKPIKYQSQNARRELKTRPERSHKYIQLVFPTTSRSSVYPDAQVLAPHKTFNQISLPRYFEDIFLIANHWGIAVNRETGKATIDEREQVTGVGDQLKPKEKRETYIQNKYHIQNHNLLRITRVLESIKELLKHNTAIYTGSRILKNKINTFFFSFYHLLQLLTDRQCKYDDKLKVSIGFWKNQFDAHQLNIANMKTNHSRKRKSILPMMLAPTNKKLNLGSNGIGPNSVKYLSKKPTK